MKNIAYLLEYPTGSWVGYEIDALRKIGISPLVCPVNVLGERASSDSFQTARSTYLLAIFKSLVLSPLTTVRLSREWKDEIGKRMFLRALYLAHELKKRKIDHIHAHFAAGAGSVAYLIRELSGVSYSMTVHAYDIFKGKIDRKVLYLKLVNASKVRCISNYNKEFLLKAFPDLPKEKLVVIHCGVDVRRYSPSDAQHFEPRCIISVANFVEKKGLIYLLRACKILKDKGVRFGCVIIGDGEKRQELQSYIENNGLKDIVSLPGMHPNEKMSEALKKSAVFVLPCIVAKDGDRDGIPVTLMEAMASGIPVISTHVSGISELIESGVNGALVAPKNERELADVVEEILLSKELSIRFPPFLNSCLKSLNQLHYMVL